MVFLRVLQFQVLEGNLKVKLTVMEDAFTGEG
jgi:hypothetical protein